MERIISFGPADTSKPKAGERPSRKSKIQISSYAVDSGVGVATEKFESAMTGGDLNSICKSRVAEASTDEEKADWTVIGTLTSENPRKMLVDYLGFSDLEEDPLSVSKQVTEGDADEIDKASSAQDTEKNGHEASKDATTLDVSAADINGATTTKG